MKLSTKQIELIERLAKLNRDLEDAHNTEESARTKWLDDGNHYSWGYYGGQYFDAINQVEDEIKRVREELELED